MANPSQSKITIITDSMSSIRALQSNKKTNNNFVKETRRYRDQIRFHFINSHTNKERHNKKDKWKVKMNKRADELANDGITSEETISWPYIPKLMDVSKRAQQNMRFLNANVLKTIGEKDVTKVTKVNRSKSSIQ